MAAIREPFEVQKFYAHRFEEETLLFQIAALNVDAQTCLSPVSTVVFRMRIRTNADPHF